jgi:hypothetical protein
MSKYGAWQIVQGGPKKISESGVELEKYLEDWVEQDPSLLPGSLEIVSRQMPVEGGRLDLLGIDPLGRLAVIELKAGALELGAVTQALYYAAQIDDMPFSSLEENISKHPSCGYRDLKTILTEWGLEFSALQKNKEVLVFLVGTKKSPGLGRMLEFLSKKYHMPITVVTFEIFQLENGERILIREFTEADVTVKRKIKDVDIEKICALADKTSIGAEFQLLISVARQLGIYPRAYKQSIMYTHPDHKDRMLFTARAQFKPLRVYIGYEAFVDYYGVTEEQAAIALGPQGWQRLDIEGVNKLAAGLQSLLSVPVNV